MLQFCPGFLVNIITIDKNTNLTVGLQMRNAANMTKHFLHKSLGEFCFPIWNRLSTSSTLLVLLLLCMNSVYGKCTRKMKHDINPSDQHWNLDEFWWFCLLSMLRFVTQSILSSDWNQHISTYPSFIPEICEEIASNWGESPMPATALTSLCLVQRWPGWVGQRGFLLGTVDPWKSLKPQIN